jgi:hypothetical protein
MNAIPGMTPEGVSRGMNSRDSLKTLAAEVASVLKNGWPGRVSAPRNAMVDKHTSGIPYAGPGAPPTKKSSYFRRSAMPFSYGGKDFVVCWAIPIEAYADNSEWHLEVWNATDNWRTVVLRVDLDDSVEDARDFEIGMTKMYDAIYVVLEREVKTNRTTGLGPLTGNFVMSWDTTTSSWKFREMMFSEAPTATLSSCADTTTPNFKPRAGHRMVEWCGRLWLFGGYNTDTDEYYNDLWYSYDGKVWTQQTSISSSMPGIAGRTAFGMVVMSGYLVIMGGEGAGMTTLDDVWCCSYENGTVSMSLVNTFAALGLTGSTGRSGFSLSVSETGSSLYSLAWAVGGKDDSTYLGDHFCVKCIPGNPIGSRIELIPNGGSSTYPWGTKIAYHTSVVHRLAGGSQKLYLMGGYDGTDRFDTVYSVNVEGAMPNMLTFALVTDTAAFGERSGHASAVFDGKMLVIAGYTTDYKNDTYSSDDGGATWSQETASAAFSARSDPGLCVYKGMLVLTTGVGNSVAGDMFTSLDGVTWTSATFGLPVGMFFSYAVTYVKRTPKTISTYDDYDFPPWRDIGTKAVVPAHERLISGTVWLSAGGSLIGSQTYFAQELAIGSVIRIAGDSRVFTVYQINNNTQAYVYNDDVLTYADAECTLCPPVESALVTNEFEEGECEGIDDTDHRLLIQIEGTGTVGLPVISLSSYQAMARGANYIRVYRTLQGATSTIAAGLAQHYLVDIPLRTDYDDTESYVFADDTSDAAIEGETNFLEVTGYSPPPFGRYIFYDSTTGLCWIGGDPENEGYWYHSATPVNVANPQKYASWFDPTSMFATTDPHDGQKATGIQSLGGDLYFFKQRSIYVLDNGSIDGKPRCISRTIGCAFPKTLVAADVPRIGGMVLLFVSELGPAYISAGGKVSLFREYAIGELSEGGQIHETSAGEQTSWRGRNQVWASYWNNTWWVLYSNTPTYLDSTPFDSRCFGFWFGYDDTGYGSFEVEFPTHDGVHYYQPLMLFPIDGTTAYTLSHDNNHPTGTRYRLTRFMHPLYYQDSHVAIGETLTIPYTHTVQTRYLYGGPMRNSRSTLVKVFPFLKFADTDGLSFVVNADGSRTSVSVPYDQERQSGVFNTGMENYRHHLALHMREGLFGDFFDVTTAKVVPSTGVYEYEGVVLAAQPTGREDEFTSGY